MYDSLLSQYKRRVITFMIATGLLLAISLVGGLISWYTHHRSREAFTRELCDKIKVGMTRDRVIEIIGCPPGDYTTELEPELQYVGGLLYLRFERWIDDEGHIVIEFDQEDKVAVVNFLRFEPVRKPGWMERVVDAVKPGGKKNPKGVTGFP